jgi:hypothetical protein
VKKSWEEIGKRMNWGWTKGYMIESREESSKTEKESGEMCQGSRLPGNDGDQ